MPKKRTETPNVNAVVHGTCRHYLPSGKLFGLSTFEDGVEIRKQIIIEPNAGEYKTIVDAGQFSPFLKDHWTSKTDSKPGSQAGSSNKDIRQGDQVQVEWKGEWYPATVVRIEKRGYLIHYTGFDASWDEYVWKNRIR